MAASLVDPEFLIGASLADNRFKVVARIGAGSMAVVYRAFDHRLETDVVVKVPKKEKLADPSLRDRFRRESKLLVQLQHPHIVRILDIGMYEQIPYVVMQFLSGGCLLDRLRGGTGQPAAMKPAALKTWLLEVARALDFAHRNQVIHRDVKPANILFDEFGNVFLSDFGLTKMMYGDVDENAADETGAGMVVGTPNYVAPEIVLGKDYDGRADQYSLGITVYHLLIGAPPMLGKTPSATMVNQTRRNLPLLSEVRKAIPEATAQAVARAISKRPEARFASCLEFAEAVIAGLNSDDSSVSKSSGNESSSRMKADETTAGQRHPESEVRSNSSRIVQRDSSRQVVRNSRTSLTSPRRKATDCPSCGNAFQLRAEHAGRTGRCVQCQTRLRIAKDLSHLTVVSADPSAESSSGSSARSADDMIIGERVFGFRMSRAAAMGLAVVGLIGLILSVIAMTLNTQKPETKADRAKEFRSIE